MHLSLIAFVLLNILADGEGVSSTGGVYGKKRNQLGGLHAPPNRFLCPGCAEKRKKEVKVIRGDIESLFELDEPKRESVVRNQIAKGSSEIQFMKGDKGEKGEHGDTGEPGQKGEAGTCDKSQIDAAVKPLKAKVQALFSSYTAEIARLRNEVHYLKSKFAHTLGSEANPAKSCKDIFEHQSFSPSGVYYLNVTGVQGGVTRAYCYMEESDGCPAGSTLVLKIDGTKPTFQYSSLLWSNKEVYNEDGGSTVFDSNETKLPTYWSTPFSKVCVGMRTDSWNIEWLIIDRASTSLYDLIADGNYRATKGGRAVWESILPGSSLQKACLREGFNAHGKQPDSAGSRIGVVADNESDCSSPDSFIGFGTAGGTCGNSKDTTCGNESGCDGDNGDKFIPAFGYVFVY